MKKIIFPFFYKERHDFLLRKWWFRMFIVIYITALVLTPLVLFAVFTNMSSGWCYDSLPLHFGTPDFNSRIEVCSELARAARTLDLVMAFICSLIIHYLIQFIFFKIIINYIVLGDKKLK